ncbi:choline transporter-like protein 2 isoform X2 [Liolophura sinensis]|uniref:choline transporter-like protein 2 isoform X2 n=1 Tax=Liolophura sinensis TaxID=3198878 RepID=UPI0031585AA5
MTTKKPVSEESDESTPLTYDPTFNGPIKKRSCTDIICCLLFVIFVAGLGVVAYFAYTYGNPRLLLYPQDSQGNLCGYGTKKDKPNLYFYDLLTCAKFGPGVFVDGCPTPQVCVSHCPNDTRAYRRGGGLPDQCDPDTFCSNPGDDTKTCKQKIDSDECPAYVLKSEAVLHRCVPEVISGKIPNFDSLVDKEDKKLNGTSLEAGEEFLRQFLKVKEYSDKVVQDLVATWWMILICLVAAMVISLLWITLMRWIAAPMVWLTIILFLGIFGFSCYYCVRGYLNTKDTEQSFNFHLAIITLNFKQSSFWLTFGIISAILLLIVLLILLFLRERICIAIALIKEGSRAVGSMLFTLLWPVIPFILQIGVISLWAAIAVFLASVGRGEGVSKNNFTGLTDEEIQRRTDSLFQKIPCDVNVNNSGSDICGIIKYGGDEYTFYLQIYNLFMLFWLVNFFIALGQMTLAGAFASYYWAFTKPKDIPTFPLLSSFGRCIRYHLGTLAFGALIIAIVQLIRVFLEYLDAKLKAAENKVAKFFLKCLKCCFWCLEKFLRFINKNAYIMVAVYGKNFCTSAKNAFFLILRNAVRVVVIDKVTDFLLFIGKLVIVGAITTAAYFFYDGRIPFLTEYQPNLNFYIIPVVVTALGSYVIAAAFFSVYDMAVDTLFLCFLEDLERHDGTPEKPYYMSKELMKILGKKNKTPKAE